MHAKTIVTLTLFRKSFAN